MDRYNISRSLVGADLVNDTANALALRSDIHSAFDAGKFVITLKQDQWVSHFLTPTANLGPEYHNMIVEIPPSVHPAFLLSRLAWAIFPGIQNFLVRGEKRLVTLRQEIGRARDVKDLDGKELSVILGTESRGRSNSPTKRKRVEPITEVPADSSKKARLESPQPIKCLAFTHDPPATIPELCNADAAFTSSLDRSSEAPKLYTDDEISEQMHISALRQTGLKAQRLSNPPLCCDYTAAERANEAGMEGPRKFGGAHLCMMCLGADYRDEEDSDLIWS